MAVTVAVAVSVSVSVAVAVSVSVAVSVFSLHNYLSGSTAFSPCGETPLVGKSLSS